MIRAFIKAWKRVREPQPILTISVSGQMTERPQVHVSAVSSYGAQGLYTWDANEQGHACATMHGRSLSHILGLELADQRLDTLSHSAGPKP